MNHTPGHSLNWVVVALATATAAACSTEAASSAAAGGTATTACSPLDDQLRVHHLQMLGTHNSYHVAQPNPVPALAYTHSPLAVQLDQEGVRAFEFDLHHKGPDQPIAVFHLPLIDEGSRCPTLKDCLQQLRTWSDAHPCHHPLVVTLENKDDLSESAVADHLDQFEAEVLSVWPRSRLVTPDDLRGELPTVQAAVQQQRWPTLAQSRGKLLIVLYDKLGLFDKYRKLHPGLRGAVGFVFGPLGDPDTAALLRDNPLDPGIPAAVQAGYLVRTFPDATQAEGQAAADSGATVVSTDYPVAKPDKPGFSLQLPGGQPSRCNPLSAPANCTAAAVNGVP